MPPMRTEPVSFGLEGVGDVELLQLAGAPAGDVEELVVDAQLDVGDQRRHGLERLEGRRQLVLLRRLGRDGDDLLASQASVAPLASSLRCQRKIEAERSVRLTTVLTKP